MVCAPVRRPCLIAAEPRRRRVCRAGIPFPKSASLGALEVSVPVSNNWAGGAARGRRAAWSVAPDDQGRAGAVRPSLFHCAGQATGRSSSRLTPNPRGS